MIKRFLGVFVVLALLASVFLMPATTFAEESDYTPDDQEQIPVNPQPEYEEDFHLSDEQIGLMSQNCPSIKTQLRRVQRADAKSRVHLGAQFEVISTNLMLNLNLRLVKNSLATAELADLVANGPITIQLSMYGGFEQVGPLGTTLTSEDAQTTTEAGDIVLYSGNQIVVFYGSNSWAYTKLGHITDQSAEDMARLLGNGDVSITISAG